MDPLLKNALLLALGLVTLGVGGEILVRGAARLARSLGLSTLIVGLTIVAFGTSAPELAVSVVACLKNQDALAVGNVVGSNIANILLVLGLVGVIGTVRVSENIARVDGPFMFAASLLFALFVFIGGDIQRWQGMLFFVAIVVYLRATYMLCGRATEPEAEDEKPARKDAKGRTGYCLLILVGLVGLKYGADLIVGGASGIAESFGMSQRVIGVTIVAIGTSLPEIATCIVAARRNQPDIAVGNIVGSNIFNVLSVLGISAAVAGPVAVEAEAMYRDLPTMLVATAAGVGMMWTGRRVTRGEGVVLLTGYVAYLLWTFAG